MDRIWEILGIAPTNDKRAIRAAYSAITKQCHPEEDPQGFKLLHKAYQQAMEYAAEGMGERQTASIVDFSYGNGETEKERLQEEERTKYGDEIKENIPSGQGENPSLLDRLAQAKEEELAQSMRSGALIKFSAILNDPKKFRRAEAWKSFFLSEDFLNEQYKESFADGMLRLLEEFHTEDNYSMVQMPSGFLMELAIAYALVLNSGQFQERAANFYAREVAASIWNMQRLEYSMPYRLLDKPENQVRLRSFADYLRLRDYNRRGLLKRQNEEEWKELLHGGSANYLYELKGRGEHEIYPQSRSVCLLDLCTFWIRNEDVPACVLEYIYKDYGLRGAEHTSTRKFYEPLKQAVLSRYPEIEETLYGAEGRAKMVSAWYKDMMRIILDSEYFYEETKEIKERVRALFAREEWQKIRYFPELFNKMEQQLLNRSVMPASLAKYLMEFFADKTGIQEQVWGKEQGEVMTEEMIHSLYYSRMILDMHGNIPERIPYFDGGKLREVYRAEENCSKGEDTIFCTDFFAGYPRVLCNQDFWHYFLMRGFGCRNVRISGREKYRRKYMVGNNISLPMYIGYLYQPSMRWQKLFTKIFQKEDTKEIPMPQFCSFFINESGRNVPGVAFTLPDTKCFRVEFYLHYVRYFLNGEEIFRSVYDFAEYEEFAKSISFVEQIFLLAITKISVRDYERAQERVEHLLLSLPLAPVSIPVIAKLLIAGEEEESAEGISTGSYFSHISLEMAAESARYEENEQEEEKTINFLKNKEEEENHFLGAFYVEDEELCFRAVVREDGFSIFRQTEFCWEELYTEAFHCGDGKEAKLRAAQEFLQGMKRPKPRVRIAFSVEGMTNEKKAEKILEALKRDAQYRGSVHGLLPYAAGYPWKEEDTKREESVKENALQRFYREYGGFLSECYCVLYFGEDDTQDKKDHVFYASMKPFEFALAFRALDWPSSYEYRETELSRKVKEKHWVVGHFGWGDRIGPDGEALPKIVAVGESGTYYYYDIIRMLREENLAALLARMFDFSKVVAVANYEGELSISRFSGELEYCYDRGAFLQSVYTEKKTAADLFTVFTKAELMGEFAVFMDGLLKEIADEPENLYFEFSYIGEGAYAMRVFLQDIMQQEKPLGISEEDGKAEIPSCKDLMQEREPLIFKIWKQRGNDAQMSRDFEDAVYWYMECGKFGKKLAGWKKITAGFDLGEGDELIVCLGNRKEKGWQWHRNKLKESEESWKEYFEEEFEEEDFEEEDFSEEDWE